MAHVLGGQRLVLEYPTRRVLDGVTLGIDAGDRIGIVGRNGDGKSSLLAVLSGALEPTDGLVTRRGGITMGVLTQRDSLDEEATVATSIVGDVPEHVWASDPAVREVLDGLVADVPFEARVGELSGGQRRRVALAALLVGEWDIIALDEPTNHLDLPAIHWLAQHLKSRWPAGSGSLLVITHDRWFLDEVCTSMWEVHDGVVDQFEGGYAAYVLARVERDRQAAAIEAKRKNLMRKELAWLRRGAPARTSKPKFRIEAANEIIAAEPPPRDQLQLQRLAVARLGKQVVDLVDAGFSYGEGEVLSEVTWRIAPGERTGILGANGAGKSTLLGLISGELTPTSGRVKHGKTVRMGILDQGFSQLADIATDRVREVLARTKTTFPLDGKDVTPAQLLERLGFAREHLSARVGELSGGQRRRLQLLLLLLDEPNVILLDEPTNDVDADMLAAMEDLLDSWPGTLIVVSHDRYLLERVTDQQYAVLGTSLRHLPGGVDEYLALSRNAAARSDSQEEPEPADEPGLTGAERHQARKDAASIERRLNRLEGEVARVHEAMAEHDQSDYEGLAGFTAQLDELRSQIGELEERWMELAEALEE